MHLKLNNLILVVRQVHAKSASLEVTIVQLIHRVLSTVRVVELDETEAFSAIGLAIVDNANRVNIATLKNNKILYSYIRIWGTGVEGGPFLYFCIIDTFWLFLKIF